MVRSGNKPIAISLLRGHQEQYGSLSLFWSERFQIPGGCLHKFFDVHCVCQREGISGLRHVVDDLQQTKLKRPLTKFTPEQKRLDMEASSHSWHCCNSEHIECMWPPKMGVVNGNPQSVKFISAKTLSFENLVLYGRYTVGNLLCHETTFRGNSVAECTH